MHSRKLNPKHRSPRTAFTLVEIMVVIVIIGILASILVPVLGGIIRRANEAAVKVEISSLENAISDFKTKFSCHPPDHITLYEFSNLGTSTSPPTGWAGDAASRAKILKIWPRFNFALGRYLNNDSDTLDTIHLSGAECLVFFLGGMPHCNQNKNFFMTGFSKNPADPLRRRGEDRNGNGVLDTTPPPSEDLNNNGILDPSVETRDGPFFEFPSSRLRDVDLPTNSSPGPDAFPEFIDTLANQTAPYLYLSSNEGRGYSTAAGLVFHPNPPTPPVNSQTRPSLNMWPEINNPLSTPHWNRTSPYLQTAGGLSWKAKTFQIISPGFGPHENTANQFCPYGIADIYDPKNTGALLPQDADNITNFSAGGRMRP